MIGSVAISLCRTGEGESERSGGRDDLNGTGRDELVAAADAALPRGMRMPVPRPDAGGAGDFVGNDIEADRKFEWDVGLRESAVAEGTGDVRRLIDVLSKREVGREEDATEAAR